MVVLSGCAKQEPVHSVVTPSATMTQSQPEPSAPEQEQDTQATPFSSSASNSRDQHASNVQECRNELNAMRGYSEASYNSYQTEFEKIAARTNQYLQIKDSISSDINDLVMPRYQFQIRELCFRIKTRLTQLVIRQAE